MSEPLRTLLEGSVAGGVSSGVVFSGVVGLVGSSREVRWRHAAGFADPTTGAAAEIGTRFDLASLTKPFVATLALRLDADGRLPLRAPIGSLAPEAPPALARRTLASLLRHRSGLMAWTPFYARCRTREEAFELLLSGRLLGAPAGTYSDCGYLLWGLLAERHLGEELAPLLQREVLVPLAASSAVAQPGPAPGVARSMMDTAREVALAAEQGLAVAPLQAPEPGEAQDGNARFLGGLAGHAGLFGGAEDLWRLASEWLRPGRVLTRDGVERALAGRGERALGWMRRRVRGSAGPALGARAFGHLGFTGGSLWIDPAQDLVAVLLGHRTSPFADLTSLRQSFHRLAADLAQQTGTPASSHTPSSRLQ